MNRKVAIALISILFGWPASGQSADEPLTLPQCYALALRRSEVVAISEQDIEKARARFNQALGEVLPKVSLNFTNLTQDVPPQAQNNSDVGTTFTRRNRPELAVRFNQTLFRGLQEITALRLSGSDRALQKYKKADLERLLFQDVATSFYVIAKIEQDIRTNQMILAVLNGRIKELKERVDLGKNRESELTAQEADTSLVDADLEKLKGDRRVAYEALSFLTGLSPHPPIAATDPLREKLLPVEEYASSSLERPDVKADVESLKLAKGDVKIRYGELLPAADLEANLYPIRVGFQRDINWDLFLNVNVPVFNWGSYGRIQETKASAKQAELRLVERERIAVNEVRQSYDSFQSSLRQYRKYGVAVQKSEASYRGQAEDFSRGLINNLDVLQSQRTWFQALRLRDDAKVQSWIDWTLLQVTAGVLP